jgi:2-keto-4-pentenoate hydratase/2-oxohepta-3-ene-1,7-dioic acid hydratase in catechol pathway
MKLTLFDDDRFGLVAEDEKSVIDATDVLAAHDAGLGAAFWVRMCRDFDELRPRLEQALATGKRHPIDTVALRAPVLNPSKVIAAAANYADHVEEMRPRDVAEWMLDFDVFLKAPSSIVGPGSTVMLPPVDAEIHYEGELALVIGREGHAIDPSEALDHVLGWTILLDMTERGRGDRSRRKSYDGFTPIGPWVVTADEVPDWRELQIELLLNGEIRQAVRAGEMLVDVPGIIAHASRVMTLYPGDVITTGAPPGVGQIHPGDSVDVGITGLGRLVVHVDQ